MHSPPNSKDEHRSFRRWAWGCALGILGTGGSGTQLRQVVAGYHIYQVELGTLEYGRTLSGTLRTPFTAPYRLALEMRKRSGEHFLDGGPIQCRITRNGVAKDLRIPPDVWGGDQSDITAWYEELRAGDVVQLEVKAPPSNPPTQAGLPLNARVVCEIWHLDTLQSERRYYFGVLGWGALCLAFLITASVSATFIFMEVRRHTV
jgi:hypothetical protein